MGVWAREGVGRGRGDGVGMGGKKVSERRYCERGGRLKECVGRGGKA